MPGLNIISIVDMTEETRPLPTAAALPEIIIKMTSLDSNLGSGALLLQGTQQLPAFNLNRAVSVIVKTLRK